MNYTEGQIVVFGLRALYRFGMAMANCKDRFGDSPQKHLEIMGRHIEFLDGCIEHLEPAEKFKESQKTSNPEW